MYSLCIKEKKNSYQPTSFLNENDQLYVSQYRFRNNHSCENAISELVGHILKRREQNESTACVFLDLSKAFDTIKHDVLL